MNTYMIKVMDKLVSRHNDELVSEVQKAVMRKNIDIVESYFNV